MTVKVPQVMGKLCELIKELMDEFGKAGDGVIGNDRFCNIQYLSAHPGLGMIDMGEDRKGPMRASIVAFDAGLMYLLVWISLCMTFVKWVLYRTVDLQLGGVWYHRMLGKSRWKLSQSLVRICSCSCRMIASHRKFSHVSGWYGVSALSFLSLMTGLSSMSGLTASRAKVMLVVASAVATPGKLPVETKWRLVSLGDETVVGVA